MPTKRTPKRQHVTAQARGRLGRVEVNLIRALDVFQHMLDEVRELQSDVDALSVLIDEQQAIIDQQPKPTTSVSHKATPVGETTRRRTYSEAEITDLVNARIQAIFGTPIAL